MLSKKKECRFQDLKLEIIELVWDNNISIMDVKRIRVKK